MATEHESSEGLGRDGYPSPEDFWIRNSPKLKKETEMADIPVKVAAAVTTEGTLSRAVVLRGIRTAIHILAALLAVWIVGPAVLGAVTDPVLQSLIVVVVAPALAMLGKARRGA